MSFLTAEWRKLVIANYIIDPEILSNYLPYGTELDLWEGNCYVSLIGFLFKNTKIKGIKIPFHVNFEEVNLRFYVRYKEGEEWKRGVVFIKEIVTKPALAFVANTLYNERYQAMPMKYSWLEEKGMLDISYSWKWKNNWQSITFQSDTHLIPIPPGSEAEFITEHYWGYSKYNETTTYEYGVKHPRWNQYRVQSFDIIADFGDLYGPEFAMLTGKVPDSLVLAEGSEISIENKRVIKKPKI
jgi:uncharacterized protein YqjF (DUF2071 family)